MGMRRALEHPESRILAIETELQQEANRQIHLFEEDCARIEERKEQAEVLGRQDLIAELQQLLEDSRLHLEQVKRLHASLQIPRSIRAETYNVNTAKAVVETEELDEGQMEQAAIHSLSLTEDATDAQILSDSSPETATQNISTPEVNHTEALPLEVPTSGESGSKDKKRTELEKKFSRNAKDLESELAKLDDGSATVNCVFHLKALICSIKAQEQLGRALRKNTDHLKARIEHLIDQSQVSIEDDSFLLPQRTSQLVLERLEALRDAYSYMIGVEPLLHELNDEPDFEDWSQEILACGAVDAHLHRCLDQVGKARLEPDQMRVHGQVEELAKSASIYVPHWKSEASGGMSDADIQRDAIKAHKVIQSAKAKRAQIQRKKAKIDAMQTLYDLIENSAENSSEFENSILSAVQESLNRGVPPSDKRLREILLPYSGILGTLEGPHARKLLENLHRDETTLVAKREVITDAEQPLSEEGELQLRFLQELLHGKVVVFLGGRPERNKKQQLETQLQIAELDWPETSKATSPDKLRGAIGRADVAILLIRWSRHSYKTLIDEAKEQGKQVATLKAGLGLHRVVHDLYDQWKS